MIYCKTAAFGLWDLFKCLDIGFGEGRSRSVRDLEQYGVPTHPFYLRSDATAPFCASYGISFPVPDRFSAFNAFRSVMNRVFNIQMSAFALFMSAAPGSALDPELFPQSRIQ